MIIKSIVFSFFVLFFLPVSVFASNLSNLIIPKYKSPTIRSSDFKKLYINAFFTNLSISYALKFITHQERPNRANYRSFPSAHTSVSFQTAVFVHKGFGDFYGFLAYTFAIGMAYSRVDSNAHDIQDVVAGAFIGSLTSLCYLDYFDSQRYTLSSNFNNGAYFLVVSAPCF
ncbi:MAG: phosphatase PAP2 family protein [bacterium]